MSCVVVVVAAAVTVAVDLGVQSPPLSFSGQALSEGKPKEIVEKMVRGRLSKFYQEMCLLEQTYLLEDKVVAPLNPFYTCADATVAWAYVHTCAGNPKGKWDQH